MTGVLYVILWRMFLVAVYSFTRDRPIGVSLGLISLERFLKVKI